MANYATLKAAIQQVIKTNGNNEITGALLQQSLLAMINSLGDGYLYKGIATPSTNPGTPDQNVYYIASTAGTYSNFGPVTLEQNEIAILKYNGSWSKDSTGFASAEELNKMILPPKFESGQISAFTGAEQNSTTRIRTVYFLQNRPMTLSVASGYLISSMAYYDETKTYITGQLVNAQSYTLENYEYGTLIRFSIRKSDDSAISTSDPFGLVINQKLSFVPTITDGTTIGNITIGGKQFTIKTFPMDQTPTIGHTGAVVSSDGVKRAIEEKATEIVAPINEQIGSYAKNVSFGSNDFAGLLWNGSQVIAANNTYDAFILEVIPGQIIVVGGTAELVSGVTFSQRPMVGSTNPIRTNFSSYGTYTIQEDENFILFTVKKSTVGALNVALSAIGMAKDIEALQNTSSPLYGKKILCLGDSMTERKGTNGKGYVEYLSEMTGATVIRCALGGATLTRRTGSYTPLTTNPTNGTQARAPFDVVCMCEAIATQDYQYIDAGAAWMLANEQTDVSELVTTIKSINLSQIDVVTIFAGTNDFAAGNGMGAADSQLYGQVLGAINLSLSALLGANPALRVFWFNPIVRYLNNTVSDANWGDNYINSANLNMRQFCDAIVEQMIYRHIPCCDFYNTLGWNQLNFAHYFNVVSPKDTTHPTYLGFESIAKRMAAFMTAKMF